MTFRIGMKRLVWLATAALIMSACSSVDDKDQPAELVDFDAEVTIERLWSRGIGGVENKYLPGPRPAVSNGVVYAASGDGKVVAVNAASGKRLWKVKLGKGLSGGVGLGGNQVYIGDREGRLFALNAADGVEIWRTQLNSEILSPATGDGKIVAVQALDGQVYALDATSGEEIWKYRTESPILTISGTSSPLMARGMVIVGTADGKVIALDAQKGIQQWAQRVSVPRGRTELDKLNDIDGEMKLIGEVLYVTCYQGAAVALSRSRGTVIWKQNSSSYHGPAVAANRVYLVEDQDNVRALRHPGGQQLWENNQLRLRKLTAPITIGNYVAVADGDGYLHLLDGGDGHFVGRKKVDGSGVRVPMVTDGDTLYVQDHDGGLSAYRITAK